MSDEPEFDLNQAHKYFSAHCFNNAWNLIDKSDRTPQEDEQMLLLSMASAWHWTQREDVKPTNLSVSYWQISRVYALLEQGDNARRFGQMCLEVSQEDEIPPFYLAYAYESLARAEMVAGDSDKMKEYLEDARQTAQDVRDEGSKEMLLADLDLIQQVVTDRGV